MTRIILPAALSLIALGFVLWLLFNKKQTPWVEMTEAEKSQKKIMIFSGTTVFLAGLVTAILLGRNGKK